MPCASRPPNPSCRPSRPLQRSFAPLRRQPAAASQQNASPDSSRIRPKSFICHSYALFRHSKKPNSPIFNTLRTLCRKHRGWGYNALQQTASQPCVVTLFTSLLFTSRALTRHSPLPLRATHDHLQLPSPHRHAHSFRHHGDGYPQPSNLPTIKRSSPTPPSLFTEHCSRNTDPEPLAARHSPLVTRHSPSPAPSRRTPLASTTRALSPPASAPLSGPISPGGSTPPLAPPNSAANPTNSATPRDRRAL